MSLFATVARLARSPHGQRAFKQAARYAQSPKGKKQIAAVRERVSARRTPRSKPR